MEDQSYYRENHREDYSNSNLIKDHNLVNEEIESRMKCTEGMKDVMVNVLRSLRRLR